MQADIFKLFKKSIEKVRVSNTPRGTLEPQTGTFNVEVDAIVKRRNSIAGAVAESEDKETDTTIHFRPSDVQYVKPGNYVLLDGTWHSILQVNNGEDFGRGKLRFLRATVSSETLPNGTDPDWS